MITETEIQQLFSKMAKAGWDMQQPLAWGYFFKNQTIEPLQQLAKELTKQGFETIDINQSFPDKIYWLQLEKIEQHTIHTLNQQNQQFYRLAEQKQLLAYDGMDVAPVDD